MQRLFASLRGAATKGFKVVCRALENCCTAASPSSRRAARMQVAHHLLTLPALLQVQNLHVDAIIPSEIVNQHCCFLFATLTRNELPIISSYGSGTLTWMHVHKRENGCLLFGIQITSITFGSTGHSFRRIVLANFCCFPA